MNNLKIMKAGSLLVLAMLVLLVAACTPASSGNSDTPSNGDNPTVQEDDGNKAPSESTSASGMDSETIATEVEAYLDGIVEKLRNDENLWPYECLYVAYRYPDDEELMGLLLERAEMWYQEADAAGYLSGMFPYDAFMDGAGMTYNPHMSMEAVAAAVAANPDDYTYMIKTIAGLEEFRPDSGHEYAYAFIPGPVDGLDSVDSGESSIATDTMWTVARMNSWLLRLAKMTPEAGDLEVAEGRTFRDVLLHSFTVIDGLASETPATLADKAWYIDAMNEMYQFTAETGYLESAGAVAETLLPDEIDDWYDPMMVGVMPDLAISLYRYGWLSENEEARESASLIVNKTWPLVQDLPQHYISHTAIAFDIINTKCIHIAVIGPIQDQTSQELLAECLRGWDPRLVAQILDPSRDEELIEAKGYVIMDEIRAFVCVDDMCYSPPAATTEEIIEKKGWALEDLWL